MGTPSGLDNEVSCAGDVVRHVRDGASKHFTSVRGLPSLRVLITNTRVPRSTKAKVAGVARLKAHLPAPTLHIFSAIEAVADRFLALASDDATRANSNTDTTE